MAIVSIKSKLKSGSFLAGNTAYDPGGYWPIATVTPAAGTTSVVISSIPSTYKHLQVRYMMRRNAAGSCQVYLRPNADTGATSKAYHYLRGNGTAASAAGVASTARIYLGEATSSTQSADIFGVGIVDILDYANSSINKTVRSFNGYDANGSGFTHISSGLWLSTSAITSLEFEFAGDATATGSQFELYGIKEV